MEYITANPQLSSAQILCCSCGIVIEPNDANMCIGCLRSKVDITESIPKQSILYFCKGCERYQESQGNWLPAAFESRELLSLCIKKIKNLSTVRLVDASFVPTEPHSRRIKVQLVVQKEIQNGAIMQQSFVVEFICKRMFCDACHRVEARDFWKAVTQVRQRAGHKKTFYYLEQILLKHPKVTSKCVNIKAVSDGLDFFFDKKDDARKLADFLETIIPCRYKESERLISHDTHSNTYNYKNTFSVEIVPICKDDIVCLPLALARSLGNISQLSIVQRVANYIYLIDPMTLKTADIPSYIFFKTPFRSIAGAKQLTNYTVMDVEVNYDTFPQNSPSSANDKSYGNNANSSGGASRSSSVGPSAKKMKVEKRYGPHSESHLLADVWVIRTADLGKSEDFIHTKTHLGHLLKPGDTVLGFDVKNSVINDDNFDKLIEKSADSIKDVILVKKIFGDKLERNRRRKWKLRRLAIDKNSVAGSDTVSLNNDFEDFMRDLEEDPLSRANVNIYKDTEKMQQMAVETTDDECASVTGPGIPRITLQEMLDDLKVDDDEEEWEDADDD